MGLPDDQVFQRLCAILFLLIYLAALTGNLLIITLTSTVHHLQSPMYFFLKNLSLIDIGFISAITPKSIMISLTNSHSISFLGCAAQVFFVMLFGGTEFAILLVMSYDRYAAICHPLHYEVIMNRSSCEEIVTIAWLSGFLYGSLHTAGTFSVHFCGPNTVDHFFCDIPSLLTHSCPREQTLEYAFIIASSCIALVCFIFMVISYVRIFAIILRISSSQGRLKTFSTCMPHLIVVTLFFLSSLISYLGSITTSSSVFMSVFYTVLPPSLNPIIYSLRNRDMKVALWNIVSGKRSKTKFAAV
ncbi:olfactory receptor 14L1-like [Thomomys bottae]